MKRREFIGLLGGAAAAWPLAAGAQQGERMRRVGIVMPYTKGNAAHSIGIKTQRRSLKMPFSTNLKSFRDSRLV
jgi:putative ABC transport system substrate-binding protein